MTDAGSRTTEARTTEARTTEARTTGARQPLVEIDQLEVRYGSHVALRDVSMPIYRNAITAIVGPSGCGKSTLLSCLNRLTDLLPGCEVRGRITLEGQDIHTRNGRNHVDVAALRRRIGMIFQRPNPFPLSIRKNLTFPLRHHGVRDRHELDAIVETVLTDVGLWDEVKHRLDAPALGLSGGQQQRLCLARAMALQPEMILLDEPCSALDPIASGVVEDHILSLRGRYTVVIVTHNLAQARRLADDVALLWVQDGAGRLVEHGPVGQIFDHPRHELTAAYIAGIRG
jgi:phosphate transport system ATP-binding protein